MLEDLSVNLEWLGGAALAFTVTFAWLRSALSRVNELEEKCERIQAEYLQHLKSEGAQSMLKAEVLLGRRLNPTDTQPIPPPDKITAYTK